MVNGVCDKCGRTVRLTIHGVPDKRHKCPNKSNVKLYLITILFIFGAFILPLLLQNLILASPANEFIDANIATSISAAVGIFIITLLLIVLSDHIPKEEWTKLSAIVAVVALSLILLQSAQTQEALNITKVQFNNNTQEEIALQKSLVMGLDNKLMYSLGLTKNFIDNNFDYIEGSMIFQDRFPEDFESYISKLNIIDWKQINLILKIQQDSIRFNRNSDSFNIAFMTADINNQNRLSILKQEIYSKEQVAINNIKTNICSLHYLIDNNYGVDFDATDLNLYCPTTNLSS
jgi:hypothetical protein